MSSNGINKKKKREGEREREKGMPKNAEEA